MKRNRLPMIVVMAGLTVLSSLAWGQVPQVMNYQGRLSNSSGEPLDTTIQMVFRIWSDSAGGTELWVETHTGIIVTDGGFLVRMGSLTPLSPGIFGQPGRYLGITLGLDQEITPRTELGSVAFTFKAGTAAWASGSDSAGIAQTVIPGAVTSLEIQDASISFDDIAPNNATQDGQVMVWSAGRSGWALGSTVTGITASSGLAGGGTGDVTLSIANDGVTSTMIQDGTVASADLALGAVAQANIADGAVSSGKLLANAVTNEKLAALAVDEGKLAANAVTGTKIAADAVTNTKIAVDAVTGTKIAADAVTQAKIAGDAVSTDKIAFQTILFEDIAPNNATQDGQVMVWSAGRSGWALGSTVTGITASSGLAGGGTGDVTLSIANDGVTSTMIQDGTVASADLALGAVVQANIANGAVSSGKLNDLAVTSAKLNDLAVTSGKLSDLAVTSGKLSDLAVTGTKIAADAVTDTKIAIDAVTNTKIAAAAVTDAKIASAAVTQSKIAVDAVSTDKIAFQTILFEDIAPNNATQDGEVMMWSAGRSGWALGSTVTGITASSGLAGGGTGDVTLSIANDGVTSTMILDGTVASADLALGAVAQANIADGAVSSGKLNDLAVTSAKLNDLAVTSGKLSDLAVTSGKLSDLAVTGTKIAADAVTDTKIAVDAVTNTKIATDAVTGTKIAAAAVTDAKIAAMAVTQSKIASDAVSTDKIVNGTILLEDLNNNGAANGEVLKWSDLQVGWLPSVDEVGSDVWSQTGNVLFTDGEWGIARFGNTLNGLYDSTHVNLGVACTTGAASPNSKYVTISGGVGNKAVSNGTVIAGGGDNLAGGGTTSGVYATVSGGQNNQATGDYSVTGGGYADTASGEWSTVPGGYGNSAGASYSFAAGYRARVNPLHVGTFVWSGYDGTETGFQSTNDGQFLINAKGGVGIGVNDPTEDLDVLNSARLRNMLTGSGQNVVISGTGVLRKQGSSRRYKEEIRPLKVDPDAYSKLQPVRFRWKEQATEDIGLIAEDVAEVLPDLVVYDEQGRPDAVKYDLLAVILLGTIQNQQERIDQLTTQAETFEQKLSQVQTQLNDLLAQYGSLESDAKADTDKKTGGG